MHRMRDALRPFNLLLIFDLSNFLLIISVKQNAISHTRTVSCVVTDFAQTKLTQFFFVEYIFFSSLRRSFFSTRTQSQCIASERERECVCII